MDRMWRALMWLTVTMTVCYLSALFTIGLTGGAEPEKSVDQVIAMVASHERALRSYSYEAVSAHYAGETADTKSLLMRYTYLIHFDGPNFSVQMDMRTRFRESIVEDRVELVVRGGDRFRMTQRSNPKPLCADEFSGVLNPSIVSFFQTDSLAIWLGLAVYESPCLSETIAASLERGVRSSRWRGIDSVVVNFRRDAQSLRESAEFVPSMDWLLVNYSRTSDDSSIAHELLEYTSVEGLAIPQRVQVRFSSQTRETHVANLDIKLIGRSRSFQNTIARLPVGSFVHDESTDLSMRSGICIFATDVTGVGFYVSIENFPEYLKYTDWSQHACGSREAWLKTKTAESIAANWAELDGDGQPVHAPITVEELGRKMDEIQRRHQPSTRPATQPAILSP